MPCFCKSCQKEFDDAFGIAEHFLGNHSQLDAPFEKTELSFARTLIAE